MQKDLFKKLFLIAALLLSASTLSTTAVYADPGCPPGCDCPRDSDGKFTTDGVMGQMEAYGEAEQVKDKAQAQQVITLPDNGPGMTCFDRALALTSKLGNIFSDRAPENMPPASPAVFGTSSFPRGGMEQLLAEGIKNVLTGPDGNSGLLQRHAENFGESLSLELGATNGLGFMNTLATSVIDSLTDPINGLLGSVAGFVNQLDGYVNSINQILGSDIANAITSLASQFGLGSLVSTITSITGYLNQIDQYVNLFNQYYTQAGGLLQQYLTNILGNLNLDSMIGQGGGGACDRIAKLWGDKPWDGAISKAITGIGSDRGVPYFRLQDMMQGTVQGLCPTPGACDNMLLAITTDAAVIDTLRNLTDTGGQLNAPGNTLTWPAPEIQLFSQGASLSDVVQLIQQGP